MSPLGRYLLENCEVTDGVPYLRIDLKAEALARGLTLSSWSTPCFPESVGFPFTTKRKGAS